MTLALWGSTAAAQTTSAPSEETQASPSKFRSPDDGWFDVRVPRREVRAPSCRGSDHGTGSRLRRRRRAGIPQSALGETRAGFGRPDITIAGGLGTENGTWGVLVGDVRHWLHDTLETQAGFTHLSVNLDFHGLGQDSRLTI